ncbi:Cadherin domain-containing protein [Caenorhabditis elegans]|uniref:Cadherin domain-containing protein n=1 Tax=Caenorhabditis elegans TaxID=6239 RepID=Q5F4U0_CAEEL|nr:Cadherin domain-containing protein [Caenorhabditis elegans]CCD65533.2 Cadherin domain-containing protein [Caenorhabditis elegans]|eukprot:NP_500204.3 CaDHerin family [Caenorhabditis elegans]
MREISLTFFILLLSGELIANERHHEHSLKHVQKRHDIPLEFIMNSQEHSDIRRSVRLEKEPNLERLSSDKFVVRRDSSDSSTEVVGDENSVPDKFDQPSYDFMLPEGKTENSTILAVVDFITRKHNVKPAFVVNFDENEWFAIGNVEKTRADNADVYKATVILRQNSNVEIAKTEGGLYRFVVEAQQGEVVLATTNISVDVIKLAPTTKRTRVTVPDRPKLMETTVPVTSSSSTSSEMIEVDGESETQEDLTLGGGGAEATSTETTTVPMTSPEEEVVTSSAATSPASTADFSDDDDLTIPVTSPEPTQPKDSEEEEEVEVLDGSGEGSADVLTTTETNEGSGELLDSSTSSNLPASSSEASLVEEEEDPITGPVSILPLQNSPDGIIEPLDIQLTISPSDVIKVPRDARPGDVIRNLQVEFQSATENLRKTKKIELEIEPAGFLEIRPKILNFDEKAMIFIGDLAESLSENLQIVAKIGNSTLRTPIRLDLTEYLENPGNSDGSEMLSLREVEFAVTETAESGRTIGQVDSDLKIIGGNGNRKFSLVGNDLILSCSQFDTEKCLENDDQKSFSLILMPKNGALAPVQVTIIVQQKANLRTSDKVIRISDNRIISPFAVITERTRKDIQLGGDAAKFLGFVKAQEGLYQIIVINSAASGRYSLDISIDDDTQSKTIEVFVENSQSHAHFRKSKYSLEVDAGKVENGLKLTQVELEGVPIDEAKIMVLDGNPGWVTVEEYGGKVNVGKYDGPIYNGKFPIRIGAVDKKTWTILTETIVEIDVKNGQEPLENEQKIEEKSGKSRVLEATFDREKSEDFEIQLDEKNMKLDLKSMYGIDEKGQKVTLDPTSITVTSTHVQLTPDSLKSLRLIGMTLKNPDSQKINILVRLISSPEYLKNQEKLAQRPIYPMPWTRENPVIHVELREELAQGQVVGVFPAVSQGNLSREIQISGLMSDAFDFNGTTGELKIKQRIDYETLDEAQKTFNLTLSSGENGFKSEAILMVQVTDVDDNSPVVDVGDAEMISLPENLSAGTKIAEFDVTDPDGSESYQVELEGDGSKNFMANITSSNTTATLSIFIAENAKIDRETQDFIALLVKILDISGNSEKIILPIRVLDVNDNAPQFEQNLYDVEVMEDLPSGMVIHRVHAMDSDAPGAASTVNYQISNPSDVTDDVISVNSTSGVVQISGSLWGMPREQPYKFQVIAQDFGAPGLNSTSILSLRVRNKDEVVTEEAVEFEEITQEVVIQENLAPDTKIYTAKAVLRGIPSKTRGKVVYTLKDLLSSEKEPIFAVDKDSGDIFVVKPIDFEERSEYTLLITAFNSGNELVTSSTLLKIRVENLDDNEPEFLPSALPIFQVPKNTSKPTAIGRLTARDADFSPIFYHLLPNCGTPESSDNFNIDAEFGEIVYEPKVDPSSKMTEAEVCFIATSQKNLDTSEVFFDANSKNFKRVKVEFVGDSVDSVANSGKINNGFSGNQSISSVGDVLDRVEIPMNLGAAAGAQDYEQKSLNFVPANYELGRDMISPEGAVELNKNTGELVANGKILDTPQGVYTAEIGRGDGGEGVKQLHHIRNDRKLRYVLSMSRNEFGANLEKFRRQILEAIGKDDQKAGKQLEIHFDEPKADRKNSTWTSVCFYLTRQNAILDENQASSIISPSNGHISKLHHIFKVQNVDMCAPKPSATSSESTSSSNSDIPLNTLILIGVVGLLIIALLALLIYVCCVSRYQRYLKQKTDQLRCSSSAGSYYKSPNLIPPPPPGYMHTPPLPPPPPPMAIAYY